MSLDNPECSGDKAMSRIPDDRIESVHALSPSGIPDLIRAVCTLASQTDIM